MHMPIKLEYFCEQRNRGEERKKLLCHRQSHFALLSMWDEGRKNDIYSLIEEGKSEGKKKKKEWKEETLQDAGASVSFPMFTGIGWKCDGETTSDTVGRE